MQLLDDGAQKSDSHLVGLDFFGRRGNSGVGCRVETATGLLASMHVAAESSKLLVDFDDLLSQLIKNLV